MFTIMYQLLIGPLQLFFEILYSLAFRMIGDPGLSIIALSLGMNLLVLPLYKRADAVQAQQRETELRLQPWVSHIRRTFHGDERFMILQTYYRQNHYKPTDALKGSVSLLLEIPFFIAAYRFLSGLTLLQGAAFGPIRDLGAPDALLRLHGTAVNVLPILMTVINLVSGYIYTRGLSTKSKVQLYATALVFLVFLYQSPAGLVFYWTLNNVFSLFKNIFYSLKKNGSVPAPAKNKKHKEAAGEGQGQKPGQAQAQGVFRTACLFLTLLIGGLIPSAVIAASPQEFVNIHAFRSPLGNVWHSLVLAAGLFLIWLHVFYSLADQAGKRRMSAGAWIACGWAVVNYMFFGTGLGNLSAALQFDSEMFFGMGLVIQNLLVLLGVGAVFLILWRRYPKGVSFILMVSVAAVVCMSAVNVFRIQKGISGLEGQAVSRKADSGQGGAGQMVSGETVSGEAASGQAVSSNVDSGQMVSGKTASEQAGSGGTGSGKAVSSQADSGQTGSWKAVLGETDSGKAVFQEEPAIRLSRKGRNVIVLMMDRALAAYVPFILEEKPQLKTQFDGFTFYPNTISHGGSTNFGSPGLYGGYEYTPAQMNRRDGELLADKHNEALKVMPVLFDRNGFEVTVSDPTYAGYSWVPDLSVFDDYPQFHVFITEGRYADDSPAAVRLRREKLERNFFCYSLMKTLPVCLQPTLYYGGSYSDTEAGLEQRLLEAEDGTKVSGTKAAGSKAFGTKTAGSKVSESRKTGSSVSGTKAEGSKESGMKAAGSKVSGSKAAGGGGYSRAIGSNQDFMNAYTVLKNLDEMTQVQEDDRDTFLMMSNNTTHEPTLLQAPDYVPEDRVDNTAYDAAHPVRRDAQGRSLTFDTASQMTHYHINVASLLLLGEWFDHLREQGVYDNTRIIVVSDHGRKLHQFKDMLLFGGTKDIMTYQAFLMVKDFGSKGSLQTADTFMTNADVPLLAMDGLIPEPVNPFTGKAMTGSAKEGEQFINASLEWDISINNGRTFHKAPWLSVHDNIFDRDNWHLYESGLLPEGEPVE